MPFRSGRGLTVQSRNSCTTEIPTISAAIYARFPDPPRVGPKGRDAEADADVTMRAEMLSYSRARGLFAGISLEGSTLRPDDEANRKVYGKDVTASAIIAESKYQAPAEARKLISCLQKASPSLKP